MSSSVAESSASASQSMVAGAASVRVTAAHARTTRSRPLRLRLHAAMRWVHIYSSLVSLTIVLFFAATGVTLNHPDWLAMERTEELTGSLPVTWKSSQGIDWLIVDEYLRVQHGVHGTVADRTEDARESALTFRAPGYNAVAFIDAITGTYRLAVSYQGAVGVLNDLHRGRDSGRTWAWLIDVVGVMLVILSLAGLALLFWLKKVRVKGFATLLVGTAVVILLAKAAI